MEVFKTGLSVQTTASVNVGEKIWRMASGGRFISDNGRFNRPAREAWAGVVVNYIEVVNQMFPTAAKAQELGCHRELALPKAASDHE